MVAVGGAHLDDGIAFGVVVGIVEELASHLDLIPKEASRRRAFLGVFGQQARKQVFEIGALELRTAGADGFGDLLEDADELFDGGAALDGQSTCECAIPDDTERVKVGGVGDLAFFFELFWGEITWGSDDGSCRGKLCFVGVKLDLGDPKIEKFKIRKRLIGQ